MGLNALYMGTIRDYHIILIFDATFLKLFSARNNVVCHLKSLCAAYIGPEIKKGKLSLTRSNERKKTESEKTGGKIVYVHVVVTHFIQ